MSDQQDLQQLREEVYRLQQKLNEVSRKLERLSQPSAPPVTREATPPPAPPPPYVVGQPSRLSSSMAGGAPVVQPPSVTLPKESFEVRLGTYWLPRVGIAALLTGMVFFAAYITPRLGVAHKVALGYMTCLVLGVFGMWMEKKTPQFARVLQAGSLALTYFVTYAAHFVEAFRVIQSPTLAIVLLSVVVLLIVGVAQKRRSPTLGGLALFFGYYTSVASGVATFTLASNAMLALAAIFFLARNRWVTISYGAVFATYLTYMIWVWKLSQWGHVDHLIFDSGYLSAEDFRLRAAFLSLYWLLFTVSALIVRREAMNSAERNGLLTLNNAFFFMLFSLLMHHAHPGVQWQFQFLFAGALLIISAVAYQRFKSERSVMDALFVQGLLVATLGLMSYFEGVRLVAVLALESVFLLMLARWMRSRWVAAIGGLAFLIAYLRAWDGYPNQDQAAIYGAAFVAAVGFVCARLARWGAKEVAQEEVNRSALGFAFLSAILTMEVAREYFHVGTIAWALTCGAIVVAMIGAALRTREILWASHVPLLWAFSSFFLTRFDLLNDQWTLAQSLMLVAVTFGFGVVVWGSARSRGGDESARKIASQILLPYVLFATFAALCTIGDYCPARWWLAVFAAQTLVLVIAGVIAGESAFVWMALITMIAGALMYLCGRTAWFDPRALAWANALVGCGLFIASERTLAGKAQRLMLSEQTKRVMRGMIVVVVTALAIFALQKLVSGPLVTVSWAGLGFVLLAFGFAIRQRSYRLAGLTALGFSLARAVFHDLAGIETIYRILSFIGLGVILLVLAFLYARNREKLARWL